MIVEAVDLVALRSELGLPADADPTEYPDRNEEFSDEESAFIGAVLGAMPHVVDAQVVFFDGDEGSTDRRHRPWQVTAAAGTQATRTGGVGAVLATAQPLDEIASTLEDEGWSLEDDGDVLRAGEDSLNENSTLQYVADAGDARLLIGEERSAARRRRRR